jgi:CBS domain-containing membrane protein
MKLLTYLRNYSISPIQLTFLEQCLATLACLIAIFLTATITQACTGEHNPVLLASMGASAVILFATPGSPLAQPWPFVGGQLLSALIGVIAADYVSDLALAGTLAVGFSVIFMLLLRCLHPPGAATALAPVLSAVYLPTPGLEYLIAPVGLNVLLMMIIALVINRLILRREYPARMHANRFAHNQNHPLDNLVGISQADIEQATQSFHQFLDIGADDLRQILTRLQLLALQKNVGAINCGDIMQRDIISIEYATEVEAAWLLMHEQQLKVLPVLDRSRRVIGIVTRYDFLKQLKLTPYPKFQDKWLAFIRRSPDITTNKPEAIGHIMTRKVKTLKANAHIAELVPLVVNEGHHHVPIVDEAGHFVGMVFQSRLMATLFKQRAATFENGPLSD